MQVANGVTHTTDAWTIGAWSTQNRSFLEGVSLDEMRVLDEALPAEALGFFNRLSQSELADVPYPANDAIDVRRTVELSWASGAFVSPSNGHVVYLGDDVTLINDATDGVAQDANSFVPHQHLDFGQTYYWRVDEVNEAETPATWQGDLWSFSTTEYSVVDDFESYKGSEGKEVFVTWFDGFGGDDSLGGSTTGHIDNPFVETTIANSGGQSMPVFYDNNGNFVNIDGKTSSPTFSQVVREFDAAQDWTIGSPTTLVLFFHGDITNTGGQVYVMINNAKVAYDGNAAALSSPFWTQWTIDLAAVGTSLSRVNSLAIGIEGAGAQGVLYVDDLRLYGQAPAVAGPQDPGTADLVAYR